MNYSITTKILSILFLSLLILPTNTSAADVEMIDGNEDISKSQINVDYFNEYQYRDVDYFHDYDYKTDYYNQYDYVDEDYFQEHDYSDVDYYDEYDFVDYHYSVDYMTQSDTNYQFTDYSPREDYFVNYNYSTKTQFFNFGY